MSVMLGRAAGLGRWRILGSRVTTFGLADLRGGLHRRVSTRAPGSPPSFGDRSNDNRRRLALSRRDFRRRAACCCWASLYLFVASLLGPLFAEPARLSSSPSFVGGVGSGTFIPLTISFIIRSLPPRLVDLWHRPLCDELGTVAECCRVPGRVVFRSLVLALDRLAILRRCCR